MFFYLVSISSINRNYDCFVCSTFEWSNTFFELVEGLTIPAIHVLEIVGTTPKFVLSGRLIKHQERVFIIKLHFSYARHIIPCLFP